MYLAVKGVKPIKNYNLILTFSNGEKRQFDMNPYLDKGIFQELRDISKFNTVRLSFDTIEWDNEADLDPEVLYKYSVKIKE
jgi:Protein of unknown function (DUF2442)